MTSFTVEQSHKTCLQLLYQPRASMQNEEQIPRLCALLLGCLRGDARASPEPASSSPPGSSTWFLSASLEWQSSNLPCKGRKHEAVMESWDLEPAAWVHCRSVTDSVIWGKRPKRSISASSSAKQGPSQYRFHRVVVRGAH